MKNEKLGQIFTTAKQDARSATFHRVGHIMASLLVLSYAVVYGFSIYQLDWWQHYFFSDTVSLSESCRIAAAGAESPHEFSDLAAVPHKKVTVPHRSLNIMKIAGQGKSVYRVHYQCDVDVDKIPNAEGVAYLHVGWVVADETTIAVNGSKRSYFRGLDKPIVPLTYEDFLAKSIRLEITATSKAQSAIGMVGNQPMVIGIGANVNARILGLETALKYVRGILNVLPMLTLAIILVFGWLFGLRLRLMLPAFYLFLMLMAYSGNSMFSEFMPWDIQKIETIRMSLQLGTNMGFLLFGMELMSLWPRKIYNLMIMNVVATVALALFFSLSNNLSLNISFFSLWRPMISFSFTAIFLFFAIKKFRKSSISGVWYRIHLAFIWASVIFASLAIGDLLFQNFGFSVVVSRYGTMFMPIFIGGMMLVIFAKFESEYRAESEKRLKLKSTFSKYAPEQIVEMATEKGSSSLLGELKTVTCLFVDIRGFTSLSDKLNPDQIIALLNRFFSELQDVTADSKGYIEKFLGDGALVTWGAARGTSAEAANAVAAALALLNRLETLNEKLADDGLPSIEVGIGIHQGEAVVGSLGSEERMEFTSIGSTVNIASRLESLCKTYSCEVIISQKVYRTLSIDLLELDWNIVDAVALRGVSESIGIATLKYSGKKDWSVAA